MSEFNFNEIVTYFPSQKKTEAEKTEKFLKDCVDAGVSLVYWSWNTKSTNARSPRKEKIINYNLYNDIVDPSDVERAVNPFKLQNYTFPDSYRNYPLVNPNMNVLFGEERRRIYNPQVTVVNSDAITDKLTKIKEGFDQFLYRNLTSTDYSEQVAERELIEFNKWSKYEYKDIRERMGTQVLEYLYRTQDLKEIFSRGFEDLLIAAEEIYVIDIIAGEPVLRKGNPLNFFTVRGGDSWKLEDNDIITEDGFLPVGEVIDRYHDYLSDVDIDELEKGSVGSRGAGSGFFRDQIVNQPQSLEPYILGSTMGDITVASPRDVMYYGGGFDTEGNVRCTRVVWRGMRKIGVKTYFDEDGNTVKEYVDEHYKADKALGEKINWIWVSEWYEGTKLANNKYVKMGVREVQSRRMDNPSVCSSGIVGSLFNVNTNKAKSMFDMAKDYQYMYNFLMYQTEMAIAKYIGKVGKIDVSMIPDKWELDKFLYYMYSMNIMFVDSFNEGQKGASLGKLVGTTSQMGNSAEFGDPQFIQQHMLLLEFIQGRVDSITGITPQRRGSVENRETVGGVERAISQSSYITEKWFSVHDNTRTRALRALLDAAKIAWKNKSMRRNYVLDDGTVALLDFESNTFKEAEYGVDVSNSSTDMEMMNSLKSLIPTLAQNEVPVSMIMDLYRTKNPATLQRKIEAWEAQKNEQAQKQQEQELQIQQETLAAQSEQADKMLELEYEKMDRQDLNAELDREQKIESDTIKAMGFAKDTDVDKDGQPDILELQKEANKRVNDAFQQKMAVRQQEFKEKQHKDKMEMEAKKLKKQSVKKTK